MTTPAASSGPGSGASDAATVTRLMTAIAGVADIQSMKNGRW